MKNRFFFYLTSLLCYIGMMHFPFLENYYYYYYDIYNGIILIVNAKNAANDLYLVHSNVQTSPLASCLCAVDSRIICLPSCLVRFCCIIVNSFVGCFFLWILVLWIWFSSLFISICFYRTTFRGKMDRLLLYFFRQITT